MQHQHPNYKGETYDINQTNYETYTKKAGSRSDRSDTKAVVFSANAALAAEQKRKQPATNLLKINQMTRIVFRFTILSFPFRAHTQKL